MNPKEKKSTPALPHMPLMEPLQQKTTPRSEHEEVRLRDVVGSQKRWEKYNERVGVEKEIQRENALFWREEANALRRELKNWRRSFEELERIAARYRDSLRFYAERGNYLPFSERGHDGVQYWSEPRVLKDGGAIAREDLERKLPEPQNQREK